MELVTPGLGLIFWQAITFLIVFFVLSRFAWKPIMKAIHEREATIERALSEADRARREIKNLQSQNEDLLKQARAEREKLISDARTQANAMLSEAQEKARQESGRQMNEARQMIATEKAAALTEIRNQVADLSITIAEKVIRQRLQGDDQQRLLVNQMLNETPLSSN